MNLFALTEPRLIVKYNGNGIKRSIMPSLRHVHTIAVFLN